MIQNVKPKKALIGGVGDYNEKLNSNTTLRNSYTLSHDNIDRPDFKMHTLRMSLISAAVRDDSKGLDYNVNEFQSVLSIEKDGSVNLANQALHNSKETSLHKYQGKLPPETVEAIAEAIRPLLPKNDRKLIGKDTKETLESLRTKISVLLSDDGQLDTKDNTAILNMATDVIKKNKERGLK